MRAKANRWWQIGAKLSYMAIFLLAALIFLIGAIPYSTTRPNLQPLSTAPPVEFAPFLDIIPSEDGTALYISAGGVGQLNGVTLAAHINDGPTHHKGDYTMVYSETVQAYVTTATGFTPRVGASGSINITTTNNLDTGITEFQRAYVLASAIQSVISRDGHLSLDLVNPDTIDLNTYIVIVPSYAPRAPASPGHRFVGSSYSVRAAGALVETAKPMVLQLCYTPDFLAGADPHTLAIFVWDAAHGLWRNIEGRLASGKPCLSTAISRFSSYVLVSTPAWHDNFDDASGLETQTNVTIGGKPGQRSLILENTDDSGSAISTPITPTTAIASWGNLAFTATVEPPTTTLTVDILDLNNMELATNVTSGVNLESIDPIQYPALKLRVTMTSTVVTMTPALEEWQLTWRPASTACLNCQLYLPLIHKE